MKGPNTKTRLTPPAQPKLAVWVEQLMAASRRQLQEPQLGGLVSLLCHGLASTSRRVLRKSTTTRSYSLCIASMMSISCSLVLVLYRRARSSFVMALSPTHAGRLEAATIAL